MKTTLIILTLACIPCFAGAPKAKARRLAGSSGAHLERFLENPGPRVLEKFDADKDGKLSDAEKSAAREAIKSRTGKVRDKALEKFDANGDGRLDESERAKARETVKTRAAGLFQRLLKRFDADGDGKLSETERAALRQSLSKILDEKE